MEAQLSFKDQLLAAFEIALENELVAIKNSNKNSLNNFLLSKIQDAEKQITEAKKRYTENYDSQIAALEIERKKAPNLEDSLWKFEQKAIEEDFERGVRITIKLWTAFINDCKSKIK
jgi:flagellar biosynthesis regulator FlaF